MGTNVFANGMEVSGKASPNKVLASMPDVCLSPPSPPAGPIPIPYPNFAMASDTTSGTKKVKMSGKEVGIKGKSSYKSSKGDEAATRSFGAGVVSHNISGPVKHMAGSFNVKFEGSPAVRFGDLTTGNHSNPTNGDMAPDVARAAPGPDDDADCKAMKSENAEQRKKLNHSKKTSTVSSAVIDGEKSWSCSQKLAKKYQNGGYEAGLDRVDTGRKTSRGHKISDVKDKGGKEGKDASNMCPKAKKKFKYPTSDSTERPHTSHTEPRLLEAAFAKGSPKKVLLSINWQRKVYDPTVKKWVLEKPPSSMPCDDCHEMLCAAQECGTQILICSDEEEPKPQTLKEKTGKDCPP